MAVKLLNKEQTPEMRQALQRTVMFVTKAHAKQFRKGSGLPYIVHPMAVLSQVAEWGVTNIAIWNAALCHDVLEDRPDIDTATLTKIIGRNATSIVEELTFIPDPNSEVPRHIQKKAYMESFDQKSIPACVIKWADRICNAFDFLCTDEEYAKKYWHKADDLFGLLMDRRLEVSQYFEDDSIATHIHYTKSTLGQMMR